MKPVTIKPPRQVKEVKEKVKKIPLEVTTLLAETKTDDKNKNLLTPIETNYKPLQNL